MSFLATNLFQAVWRDLGRVPPFHQFAATGGSATTIVNTAWNIRDVPEDDYCKDWTAVVARDAGGAGADPEGKLSRITAFNSATYTYTMDTVTTAVASGDEILIANSDIPLYEMYAAANRALQDFGEVHSEDTSLTMASNTYRYLLPVGTRRDMPILVEWEDTYYQRYAVRYTLRADNYLHIPAPVNGYALHVTYIGPHAKLTAYNTAISEDIHPALAIAATTVQALRWLIGTQQGGSDFDKQRYNEALVNLERAKMEHPVRKYPRGPKYFVANRVDVDNETVDNVHLP